MHVTKFLPGLMQIGLMSSTRCWKGFAIWGQRSLNPCAHLKELSRVALCLHGNPTYSVIVYASLRPGGSNLLKGGIFVFIPQVMWKKFGNRARYVSAELFLILNCVLQYDHWNRSFSGECTNENIPRICAIRDDSVFSSLSALCRLYLNNILHA